MNENPVYHCIIGYRNQLHIDDHIISPFEEDRNYTTRPEYKKCSEGLLENYRLKYFPNYPSRNNCLFVCKSEESAIEWGTYKCRTSGCDNFFVYTLDIIEGEVFYFDTNWFEQLAAMFSNGEIPSSNKYSVKECVKGFWSGTIMASNDNMMSEGLFKGRCKVSNKRHFHYNPIARELKEIPIR